MFKTSIKYLLFGLTFMLVSQFGGAHDALAVSFSSTSEICYTASGQSSAWGEYDASLDNSTYTSTSRVTISGSASMAGGHCDNFVPSMSAAGMSLFTRPNTDGSVSFVIPCGTAPGNYDVGVSGSATADNSSGTFSASTRLPYTVTADCPQPPAPATVTVNPGSCPSTINWTSSTGHTGTGGESFTFDPTSSGTSVSIGASNPPGYTFNGTTPSSRTFWPGDSDSFRLDCTPYPPPTASLSTNDTSLSCGETATLTWGSTDATSCSTPWGTQTSGTKSGVGAGKYQISCSGLGGSAVSNEVEIVYSCVTPPDPPQIISFTATPSSLGCGETSTVSWDSINATSCSTPWSSVTSGSQPGVNAGTYSISCTGPGGTTPISSLTIGNSCAVIPTPPPPSSNCKVDIVATPSTTALNTTVDMAWSIQGASACMSSSITLKDPGGLTVTGGSSAYAPFCSGTPYYGYDSYTDVENGDCRTQSLAKVGRYTATMNGDWQDAYANTYTNTDTATVDVSGSGSTIRVSSNISSPSPTWTINPGNHSGTGTGSASVTPGSSGTTYTITPGVVAGYDYPPTIDNSLTGTGSSMTLFGGETESFRINYNKTPSPFNYSLSSSDVRITKRSTSSNLASAKLARGAGNSYGQTVVNKTFISGTTQSVTLSISGEPSGVTYSFSNQGCSPTCADTITFTIPSSVPAGVYPITVTGNPGSKTTRFNLDIGPVTAIIATCTPSVSTVLVGDPVTWSSTVSGGSPPYTYVWTGSSVPSPAPSTASFGLTYSTVGQKTAQINVTDSLGSTGSCVPGTVQVNFNPKFQEF